MTDDTGESRSPEPPAGTGGETGPPAPAGGENPASGSESPPNSPASEPTRAETPPGAPAASTEGAPASATPVAIPEGTPASTTPATDGLSPEEIRAAKIAAAEARRAARTAEGAGAPPPAPTAPATSPTPTPAAPTPEITEGMTPEEIRAAKIAAAEARRAARAAEGGAAPGSPTAPAASPAAERPAPAEKPAPPPPVPEPPIIAELKGLFGEAIVEAAVVDQRPTFVVDRNRMVDFAQAIRERGYDYPACITGVDWPDAKDASKSFRETVYHFRSMKTGEWAVLKARCPSDDPWLNSLFSVYHGADWNEREVYDLFGIEFRGHPDLRRILMPEDWTGHPLLKSYRMSTYYSPAGNERQK